MTLAEAKLDPDGVVVFEGDHGASSIRCSSTSIGPASFMIVDPDGNTILIDQHV
jgi:hypothetical protein